MWVARDKDKSLWLYSDMPEKKECLWSSFECAKLNPHIFPEVQWKDDHPTEVELVKEKSNYLWLARDKDGELYLYTDKPFKHKRMWKTKDLYQYRFIGVKEEELPEELRGVSWNDEEPMEVTVKIEAVCG